MSVMLHRAGVIGPTEVPRRLASAVLTDFERYPEWLPGLVRARILAREGDVAVLEVWAPAFRAESVVLELILSSPVEICFRQVGRHGKPDVAGCWRLLDESESSRVLLELDVRAPMLHLGYRRRLKRVIHGALAALADRTVEIEAGNVVLSGDKRKILEVVDLDGSLEIRLRGNRYRLVRVSDEEEPP